MKTVTIVKLLTLLILITNKQSGSLFIILLYFMQTCYSMNNNMFQPNNNSRSQPDVPSGQRDRVEREAPEALNTPTNPEIPQKTSDKPSSPEATTNKDTPDENKKAFGTINVEQYIDAEMNIRFSIKNTDENTLYYLPKILMYTNFNDTVKRDECELDFTDHSSIAVQCINDKVSAIVNISPETYNQLRNTINFTSENKSMKEIGINKELTDLLYNCVMEMNLDIQTILLLMKLE